MGELDKVEHQLGCGNLDKSQGFDGMRGEQRIAVVQKGDDKCLD